MAGSGYKLKLVAGRGLRNPLPHYAGECGMKRCSRCGVFYSDIHVCGQSSHERSVARQPTGRPDESVGEVADRAKFDRQVYQRGYMREYMRKWRQRQREGGDGEVNQSSSVS